MYLVEDNPKTNLNTELLSVIPAGRVPMSKNWDSCISLEYFTDMATDEIHIEDGKYGLA